MAFTLNGQEQKDVTLTDLHHRFTITSNILGATFNQYPVDREPDSLRRIVADLTRHIIHRSCTLQQIEKYLPNADPLDIINEPFSFHFFQRDGVEYMRIAPLEPSI